MTTKKPEALRLADKYEVEGFLQDHRFAQNHWCMQAAVELRRLHARVQELEGQQGTSTYFTNTTTRIGDFGERYRAMLAAAPQPPEASGHPPFEMEDGAVAVPPADPTMARFLRTT